MGSCLPAARECCVCLSLLHKGKERGNVCCHSLSASVSVCARVPLCLCLCPCLSLSVCLSFRLSVYLSIYLSIPPSHSVYLYMYLSDDQLMINLSDYLSFLVSPGLGAPLPSQCGLLRSRLRKHQKTLAPQISTLRLVLGSHRRVPSMISWLSAL